MYEFFKSDKWFLSKKIIEKKNTNGTFVKEWQIWWINAWINIWSETYWKWDDFKRPFLVIKKAWNMFIWVLTTTKWNIENDFYLKIPDWYMEENSYLMKTQFKSIDKKRFIEKMCTNNKDDLIEIKKELREYIF